MKPIHLPHFRRSRRRFLAAAAGLLSIAAWPVTAAQAATDVVTSLPELGALAKAVGGNKVSVYAVAQPNRDYHRIEPRPSDVRRIANADLVVINGLGFDSWMDALLNAAANSRVRRGGSGFVNASASVPVIEQPTSSITGASGDVHPDGNPHYLYDPIYAKFAARNIVQGLIRVDGKNADEYRRNYAAFNSRIDQKMNGWKAELAPFAGRRAVTYHRNYNYFLRRFGIVQYGTLEPRPGIPPSARHINSLIAAMKRDDVDAILVEGIYPTSYAQQMARQLGGRYTVGPYSVGSMTGDGYLNMMDRLVDAAKSALRR